MTWVAAAIIGGSVVGAGASAYGADRAAGAAARGSRRAIQAEREMFDIGREDLRPYRELGYDSIDEIRNLFLGTGAEGAAARGRFETSPQYEFVRDEAQRGLVNSASARGGVNSGNAAGGIARIGAGLASGEFNSYVDRLFSAAGLGGSATSTGVAAGSTAGQTLANIYTNEGNARGSAYMAGAQGVNSAVQGGLQNWAFNTYMNRPAAGA